MKRIIRLILAAIIAFNLSACSKTRNLLEPNQTEVVKNPEEMKREANTTTYQSLGTVALLLLGAATLLVVVDHVVFGN